MIAFFPEFYPDELLYSLLARYHARSGYVRFTYAAADLFKNPSTHPDIEFINPYTDDTIKWITKSESWESVLERHTMYPAYIRFLPQTRRNEAVKALSSCTGNWKNLMGIPKSCEKRYLRYCPLCAAEDRREYGETYWHRAHQLQRIRICPKHSCFLEKSCIPISAKSSPGLHDAESFIPLETEIKVCESQRELDFTAFVLDVLQAPIDLNYTLPIGIFLHSHLSCNYVNDSKLVRNMAKLYEDYLSFYGNEMTVMKPSYMEKIYNGYMFDHYFVLQLAFFEGISSQDITHLPADIPQKGIEKLYQKLAEKYRLDISIISEIGNSVLRYSSKQVSKKTGPQAMKYQELDEKYLPHVKRIVNDILHHPGRPEKLSFAKVQKKLKIPQKQIFRLPKCKEFIEQHIESQPEYWAREVTWAIDTLKKENRQINCRQIINLTNMRMQDIECCCPHITNPKIQSLINSLLATK